MIYILVGNDTKKKSVYIKKLALVGEPIRLWAEGVSRGGSQ